MTCYACNAPAETTCARCGRAYCPEHGAGICALCANPASGVPAHAWYRGSVLALVAGSIIGIWLLVAPPNLRGTASEGAPSGTIGGTPQAATPAASPAAGASASPTGTPGERRYTVKPGDTLAGIAAQLGTTVDAITKANNISQGAIIQPGQELKIPQ